MKHTTFSIHKIEQTDKLPFSELDYSRFKYGSKSRARKFGKDLATQFYTRLKQLVFQKEIETISDDDLKFLNAFSTKQVVVIPSPYDFIPTATFAMKDYFIATLNEGLVELGIGSVQESKISRDRSYNDDYGLMTAEERKKAISGDNFHIDPQYIKGKFVIFLDDIYITGGHEGRMELMVENYDLDANIDYMYMYYAEMTNKDIPAKLEHYLNHAFVKDLWDVTSIIRDDEFIFNTRVVKFILSSGELPFCIFISHQSESFREALYHYMLGNKYHTLPEFKTNYLHLKTQDWMNVIKVSA